MNTNNITAIIPGVNMLPPQWQGYAALLLAASPYITRAIYAIRNDGGIRGIFSSIWLGTNTPKTPISGPGFGSGR